MTTIRPQMPKPLFAGTPLPIVNPPTNLEGAQTKVPAAAPAPAASTPPPPPAMPAAPVLKPAGRVSIPVSFPVDGQVHRFRKVNDRAELSLTIKPVSRSTNSRWLAAGVLGAGLAVLWLANRTARKVRALRPA